MPKSDEKEAERHGAGGRMYPGKYSCPIVSSIAENWLRFTLPRNLHRRHPIQEVRAQGSSLPLPTTHIRHEFQMAH
ncbi:hypothetical protein IG631_19447 [Alternaria alternata]|nr:hypothetical protein IG631_19447 [Alternaria alternata]